MTRVPTTARNPSVGQASKKDDRVTIDPLGTAEPRVDDIVLVRCRGHDYLHLVKARQGARYLIGNNRGGINGWVTRRQIFGVATRIEADKVVATIH